MARLDAREQSADFTAEFTELILSLAVELVFALSGELGQGQLLLAPLDRFRAERRALEHLREYLLVAVCR